MAFSSGTRTALGEAASWLVAGACLIAAVVYFDELKAAVSPFPQSDAAKTARTAGLSVAAAPRPAPVSQTRRSGDVVELTAGDYGHFSARARINGTPVDVLVDTGASFVALTWEDAERTGIYVSDSDFKYKSQTANGYTRIAIVEIASISIEGIEVRNVRASVHEPGKLHMTLLGMSFLGKLHRAEMRSGRLILEN
jgi:aspartyl protease family protein